jgi:hypothetical protein
MSYYLKDPAARVDYAIDWTPYLDGQSILASVWAVAPDEPDGVAVAEAGFAAARTVARLEGGILGRSYRVSNQVTLSDGSVDERSITLRVEER